jgi:RarD protein
MEAKFKIIFAMSVFGTLSIFVKHIPLPSAEIALFRAIIAATVIAAYKAGSGSRMSFSLLKKDLPLLFLSGAAMGFNWILLFQAYKYTSVAIATLSYYFAPMIVMAACPILFKERLGLKQAVCFLMASIGLVMVIGLGAGEASTDKLLGIGFGLGAALLYASVILLNKGIKTVSGMDRTLIQFFAAIIVLTPYVCVSGAIPPQQAGSIGLLSLLVLGLLHTGLAYCLYFSSLKDLSGQQAAILSYIDPLVAILVSVSLLAEHIRLIQILGGMMILGFTLLSELKTPPGGNPLRALARGKSSG